MDIHLLRQLRLASLILVAACLLAFAPDAYLPMLARAFMPWWSLLFAGVAVVYAFRRRWWVSASSSVAALLVLLQVRAEALDPIRSSFVPDLRVAHMNVWQPNTRHAEVISTALATGADVISFHEVSIEWSEELVAGLAATYPHHRIVPRANCYGIALFSKLPFVDARIIEVAGAPFIMADLDIDGRALRIYAVHATSPTSYGHFRRRNAQLAYLTRALRAADAPAMVIGDLNTVHWDDAYRAFCAGSGAQPANSPFVRTWPSMGPFALIPLDHLLLRGPLMHTALSSFRIQGSDHRGLVADIRFTHAS